MTRTDKFLTRIDGLIAEIDEALDTTMAVHVGNEKLYGRCRSIVFATRNLCVTIFEGRQTPYTLLLDTADLSSSTDSHFAQQNRAKISSIRYLLSNLKTDIETGIIGSIISRTQARVFDDFIDHADHYLEQKRKNEAGVIAGVTFEDTIRRLCTKNGIEEKGKKLNSLIDELARVNVLSGLEAKRARVAADVRTKATHAQWDEVDEGTVKELIGFLRSNLIL